MILRKNDHFIETICAKYGELQNLELHLDRVQRTLAMIDRNNTLWHNIAHTIMCYKPDALIPLQRITFTYSMNKVLQIIETNYTQPQFISIVTVDVPNTFSYEYKLADRDIFAPYTSICNEHKCPLFVRKKLITDTHFSNVVLQIENEFFTPRNPLLKGTQREYLINNGIIQEKDLKIEDLHIAKSIHLINAMNTIGDLVVNNWE